MTLRLSTNAIHQQGLSAMLRQQSNVARAQLDLTTQTKLHRAADDPQAMSQSKRLDHALAMLGQQDTDATVLQHRLRSQESALTDAGSQLDRARELAVRANNASLSDGDRASIAAELREIRASLLAVANRDDGAGTRLFAGTRGAGVAPFADGPGGVTYAGDDGRNRIEVAPDLLVDGTDPGSDLFLRVRTGDGTSRTTAAAGNTGTGTITSSSVTDHAAWAGRTLTVEFTAVDAWRMVDDGGMVIASGAYVPGQAISAGGMRLELAGTPAAGDGFTLQRAPVQDVFATLDHLADALEAPATTDAQRAARINSVGNALGDIRGAQDHLVAARASTGSRLQVLDEATDSRDAIGLGLETMLSNLRDVDPAEAASRLALQSVALEAAQRTLISVQSLSMFKYL